ncbi:hypothetical protein IHN63_10885 [Deinococcus sp. 6YEL10]|uniref:sacsin N-terminal ATP-binding-like domain-containing protein n=1 Tax=Deinococcus sp. 6YEL10 TaxID=2745870 RepID=UPI001E422685|nr:hypothetical protein [Deinococcus sp. 6YEL10]MCD0161809.1 hypothetical protein [Deinococcus sp. 6YEL10]
MTFLERLYQERKQLADVLNNAEYSGIRGIVEELYPDKAHFLYELLQNAEDTQATQVTFRLEADRLTFEHNGVPFSEADVRGITNIGKGTKRDSDDKIGRFGVGFKAVFAYTETPSIWSPSFSFRLESLVLPTAIKGTDSRKTRFEFPFNNPKKPAGLAYDEILEGLQDLEESALLFLPRLERIEWQAGSGEGGQLERVQHSAHHVEVRVADRTGESSHRHYLKFERPVRELPDRLIGVAFDLEYLPDVEEYDLRVPLHKQLRVVPAAPGQVFVFFPADKEVSGLHFHVQAPFVPELSRASVKDTPANEPLFEQLAELAAAALPEIRDLQLLTADFLGVLPHAEDTLSEPYEPIRDAIIEAMNQQPLTPTHEKGHAPASLLMQAPASLKALVKDEHLGLFWSSEEGPVQWAVGASRNSRTDRFLSSLDIDEWDISGLVEHLADALNSQEIDPDEIDPDEAEPEDVAPVVSWLEAQLPGWFRRFYALLARDYLSGPSYSYAREQRLEGLKKLRLVRSTTGQLFRADDVYFALAGQVQELEFNQVDPGVYSGQAKDLTDSQSARGFLVEIGVKQLGEVEQMRIYLREKYGENLKPDIRDIDRFIDFLKKHPDEAELFSRYYIVAVEKGKDTVWSPPDRAVIGDWLSKTGLETFYAADIQKGAKFIISPRYGKLKTDRPQMLKFWRAVGVQSELPIARTGLYGNPQYQRMVRESPGTWTDYGVNADYHIAGIAAVLRRPALDTSLLIWRTMNASEDHVLQARYRNNSRYDYQVAPSQLVIALSEASWVPQGEGKFLKPDQSVPELLPRGFKYDSGAAWLKAIGFGKKALQDQAKQQQQRKIAQELGFQSDDDLRVAQKFTELPLELREKLLSDFENQQKEVHFSDRESANPERRSKRVVAEGATAPVREREERLRSVDANKSEARTKARAYLIGQYTRDGEVICQICRRPMPFRLSEDQPYLEAIQFIESDRHHPQNHLALCPNHRAMFRHVNESRGVLREGFAQYREPGLQVILAGQEFRVYFTRNHFNDLKSLLGAELI